MELFKEAVRNLKKSKRGAGLIETLIITAVLGTLAIATLVSLTNALATKNTQVVNKIDNGITNSID